MIKNSENQIKTLLRLYAYASDYKLKIISAVCFSILNKVFDLFPPLLIGLAVDTIVKKDQSFLASYGDYTQFDQLLIIAFFTVIVWLLESLFEFLFAVQWKQLAQRIQHMLRMDSFQNLLRLDQKFLEGQNSGEFISIINDDVNQLERFLDGGINDLIQVFVTVLVIGGIYFFKSPYLALLSFITMPLIVFAGIWFQGFLTPLYSSVRGKVGLLISELNNSLQGMTTIKSFAREHESYKKLESLSLSYYASNERAIYVSSIFTPLIRILVMCGFLTTLLVGGRLTLDGQLEVGTFSVLIFLIQRLLWPLTRLGQTLDLFQRAMASVYRIFNLLKTPVELCSGDLIKEKAALKGKIEFKHTSFSYTPAVEILSDFNLTIEQGKSIGIVGSTGSGKSTLIKLLQRFYDPTKGSIFLDQVNLKDYNLASLRSAIAIVSQDVYLFHGTILENLKFSNPEALDNEVFNACETSCIHDFVQSLPEQYQTVVGERGQRLSGGQRQRLSIARMLLAKSPVVVLDEATSAVDNIMEAKLQKNLEKVLKNKTKIIIAHRLSTIVSCDEIIVLQNGQIIEKGNHANLISNNSVYKDLWDVQTGQLNVTA